jgi:MFS family permease
MSVNVPNYNAEVAPPEVRGGLVALQQLAIVAGIMISFWIDYGTNYIGGTGSSQSDAAWLVPICLQLVPGLILGAGMIFMPFSPRWLTHHDREQEAHQVLCKLRNLPPDHALVEIEFLEIKAQSLFDKQSVAKKWPVLAERTAWNTLKLQFVAIGSLFTSRGMFQRVIIATVTMFFQQFTGINAGERWLNYCNRVLSDANSPILRTIHIRRPRPIVEHDLFTCHRCGWYRHVSCHYPSSDVCRQARTQAGYDRGWYGNVPVPLHNRRDLRPKRKSMGHSPSSWLGMYTFHNTCLR